VDLMLLLAVAGVAAGGLSQAVTGLGFALVAAPGLIALLGPTRGVGVVVLLGTLASMIPLVSQWRDVLVRDGSTLLVPTLLATPIVGTLVAGADTAVVAMASGLAVLLGVALLWRGLRWRRLHSWPGAIAAGGLSATLNVVGGVGGPPLALYAANAGWPPQRIRATLQALFVAQGIVTVAVVGFVWPDAGMIVALVIGTIAGTWLAPRVPAEAARRAVLVVAALGGLGLTLGSL
jgi:uncharacterized membrane protein YfcA